MTSGERLSEPNVTPLVDVLLVLLIIFMLATPTLHTIDAGLPRPPVGGEPMPRPEAALYLVIEPEGLASGALPYGRIVEALDAVTAAGATRIGIVPSPDAVRHGRVSRYAPRIRPGLRGCGRDAPA